MTFQCKAVMDDSGDSVEYFVYINRTWETEEALSRKYSYLLPKYNLHEQKACIKVEETLFVDLPSTTVNTIIHPNELNEEKAHKCDQCKKEFATNKLLMVHMNEHKEQYSCKYCDKPVSASRDLVRHMKTHNGENPFRCTQCSRKFTQS